MKIHRLIISILFICLSVSSFSQIKFYKTDNGSYVLGTTIHTQNSLRIIFNSDSTQMQLRGNNNRYDYTEMQAISNYLNSSGVAYSGIDELINNITYSTSTTPYNLDISKGNITGTGSVFKFGAGDVTTDETIIWDGGDGYNGFLTTGTTLDIRSTSTLDVNGGTGAWNIIIYGLSSVDSTEISEIITLNGTTTVNSINSYLRVYRALVISGGSLASGAVLGANQGTINIFIDGGTTTPDDLMAQIKPNKGQTLMCIYTVPKGKTLYVTGVSCSVGSGKEVRVSYKFRNSMTSNGSFSTKYDLQIYQTSTTQNLQIPLRVPEFTDVIITGKSSVGTIETSASFGGYLIDN